VCCRVLEGVAVCSSVLQGVAGCCGVLQCVAVRGITTVERLLYQPGTKVLGFLYQPVQESMCVCVCVCVCVCARARVTQL